MKREELDKLRAKYLEGRTSIQEERKLKDLDEDEYFKMLSQPDQTMDWSFDSFLEKIEGTQIESKTRLVPISRRIVLTASIAAAILLGLFLIRPSVNNNISNVTPSISQLDFKSPLLDVERPKEISQEQSANQGRLGKLNENAVDIEQLALEKTQVREARNPVQAVSMGDENIYVEINGVKIYDEQQVLQVTQTALQLATSNLKKGMQGVGNIKYLKIEI